jgi:hypothetical protein
MFNLIPEAERKMIENYILHNAVPTLSPEYLTDVKLHASLEHILRYWSKRKQWLFESFGNQFIHSKEVKIKKPNDNLRDEFRSNSKLDTYYLLMMSKLEEPEFVNEVSLKQWVNSYCCARRNSADFMDNKYTGPDINCVINKKKINIVKGMKMTKAIRKISELIGISTEMIDGFCTEVSRILNDKYLIGELCVSIHPLDYMTMSDNDSDWRSCMRWDDDGCYKQGTVEMMNSDNVVVVYLKSKNDMKIGIDEYWNNKKWRCLYIVDKDFIFSVKPYPYYNKDLLKAGAELIAEVMNKNLVDYQFDIPNGFVFDYDSDYQLDAPGGAIFSFETGYMYNDIEEDTCTTHYTIFADRNPYGQHWGDRDYCYSGESECMFCGELTINREDELVCEHCAYKYWHQCEWCNCYIPSEIDLIPVQDMEVCPHCYNNVFVYDEVVDHMVHKHGYYDSCICTKEEFDKLVSLDCMSDISNRGYGMSYACYDAEDYPENFLDYLPMYRVHELYDINYRHRLGRINIRVYDQYNPRGYWYYLDIFDAAHVPPQVLEKGTVSGSHLEELVKTTLKHSKEKAENDN